MQESPSPWDRADEIARRLEELPDQRLALVTATYDRSAGKLVVVDDDTGARVEIDVVSGGRPRGAPIPKGRYEILEQGKNGQFRLDAIDAKPEMMCTNPQGARTSGCIIGVEV
jgi:hypothetical protein